MKRYDIPDEAIEHICKIIANHPRDKDIDTVEFRIIRDADRLVNIPTDLANADKENLRKIIDKTFRTSKGRQIAMELFVRN